MLEGVKNRKLVKEYVGSGVSCGTSGKLWVKVQKCVEFGSWKAGQNKGRTSMLIIPPPIYLIYPKLSFEL